ncbi:MAG: hypothetical protein EOM19_04320, partial [Candidatus Moranbacteria bacterium]|nr:hypothetical protein [Candidatus Moranbacteria bacterium]
MFFELDFSCYTLFYMTRTKQKKSSFFFWVYAVVFSFVCFGMFSGEVKAYTYSATTISPIKKYDYPVYFGTLSWTEFLVSESAVSLEIRAGNTDTPDGSWSEWTPVSNGGSLHFLGWNSRVQIRIIFEYNNLGDPNLVPRVENIQVSTYSGELISSVYDTRNHKNKITKLTWEESKPGLSDVLFQIRTSRNASEWSPWCSVDNGGIGCSSLDYFTDPSGGETVDDEFSSRELDPFFNDDRFVQYRMVLITERDIDIPFVSSTEVFFDRVPQEAIVLSPVKDFLSPALFSTISWNVTLPNETSLSMKVRSGNTDTPDESWSAWIPIENGGDISQFAGNRYLQYQSTFSSYDVDLTPTLSDVTVSYVQYPVGSFLLTSSPYNSSDASNLVSKIEWDETLLPQTDIRFQLRTAPDLGNTPNWTQGSTWCGPTSCALTTDDTDFADSYYTHSEGESTNPIHLEGNDDQWMQYATWISNENTGVAPTLSEVALTYLVNAPPMVQNVTATPNQDRTIAITYQAKDPDTESGTFTQGEIIPSFEYCPHFANNICPEWFAIPSQSLREEDSQRKQVNQETYLSYDALWTPSSTIPNLERNNAKLRVTVNDSEGANNTASSDSDIFILDTKAPDNLSLTIDASQVPAKVALSASDASVRFMKVSLTPDFSDTPDWEPFSPFVFRDLLQDPSVVYAQFKDSYGNQTSTIQTQTLETPINSMSQDTSNLLLTPPEYRIFISFKKSDIPLGNFSRYELFRKEGESSYETEPYDTRTAPGENYLTDSGEDVDPQTIYTYKIRSLDNLGNISFFSQEVTAKANGIQDFGEGGGGSDGNPPTIANVTVTNTETTSFTVEWETDELSDSVVEYRPTTASVFLQTGVSTYTDSQNKSGKHRVVVSNLTPDTPYLFKVSSTDPQGNRKTDDNASEFYQAHTDPGPAIYGVAVQSAYNTQATLVWNTNVLADTIIHYSESRGDGTLLTPITISGSSVLTNNHQITLSGLTQGTDYYFEVTSTDSQGNIANNNNGGNYFQFSTTVDTTPPELSAFQTPVVSNSKAVITFNTDENASSKLFYKKTNEDLFQEIPWKETYDRSHYIVIDSLSPQTQYEYYFLAKDINQNERESQTQTFQTLVDPEFDHPPLEKIQDISDPPHILTDQKAVITFTT